jgi:hypothetical protein
MDWLYPKFGKKPESFEDLINEHWEAGIGGVPGFSDIDSQIFGQSPRNPGRPIHTLLSKMVAG